MNLFFHSLFVAFLFFSAPLFASLPKVHYPLTTDPIDVVIPYHPKDAETLELCIEGIRRNGQNIRRIIVVSEARPTESAEWFDEKNYPFTKEDLALEIFRGDAEAAQSFLSAPNTRIGWIYQQFLKLFAYQAIPDLSPNILILDSDVIYFRPTYFIDPLGQPLFLPGTNNTREYFEQMAQLLPGLRKASAHSGIVHHMPFQKPILDHLFQLISAHHQTDPWRALCRTLDHNELYKSCLSEYEIYFNFVLLTTNQYSLRRLHWTEIVPDLRMLDSFRRSGYAFIASQEWYRRENSK